MLGNIYVYCLYHQVLWNLKHPTRQWVDRRNNKAQIVRICALSHSTSTHVFFLTVNICRRVRENEACISPSENERADSVCWLEMRISARGVLIAWVCITISYFHSPREQTHAPKHTRPLNLIPACSNNGVRIKNRCIIAQNSRRAASRQTLVHTHKVRARRTRRRLPAARGVNTPKSTLYIYVRVNSSFANSVLHRTPTSAGFCCRCIRSR